MLFFLAPLEACEIDFIEDTLDNTLLFCFQTSTSSGIWTRWSEGQAVFFEQCSVVELLSDALIVELNCEIGGDSLQYVKDSCSPQFCEDANPPKFCSCDISELISMIN